LQEQERSARHNEEERRGGGNDRGTKVRGEVNKKKVGWGELI
jgi:hypothetical protein